MHNAQCTIMNATFDWFSFAFDIMFDSCYDWLILRLANITFGSILRLVDITFSRYYDWSILRLGIISTGGCEES
jgi:hypothetical protein